MHLLFCPLERVSELVSIDLEIKTEKGVGLEVTKEVIGSKATVRQLSCKMTLKKKSGGVES
jgi:hypothetical protein